MARKPNNKPIPVIEMETPMSDTTTDGNGAERKRRVSWNISTDDMTLEQLIDKSPCNLFRVRELPQTMTDYATLHGLKQKLQDKYAGRASAEEAAEAARSVWDLLMAGMWNEGRTGEGAERVTDFLNAYHELLNSLGETITIDEVRARVNKRLASDDPADHKKVERARNDSRIVTIMNRLQRDRMERRQASRVADATLVEDIAAL